MLLFPIRMDPKHKGHTVVRVWSGWELRLRLRLLGSDLPLPSCGISQVVSPLVPQFFYLLNG